MRSQPRLDRGGAAGTHAGPKHTKNNKAEQQRREMSVSKILEVAESIPRRESEAVLEAENRNGEEVTLIGCLFIVVGRSSLIRMVG